jgi:hypothetical protein
MSELLTYIDYIARGLEFLGVLTMIIGIVYSFIVFFRSINQKQADPYVTLGSTWGNRSYWGWRY